MTIHRAPAIDWEIIHHDARDVLMKLADRVAALEAAAAPGQAPLLWVLWHHQGARSSVGQAIRAYLGMGQFQRMSTQQIEAASSWADLAGAADPTPPPAPDHLGDATDNGLLRCYAVAVSEAIAHHQAGQQQAMQAGRRAIYYLGRRHGAAQARQESNR